MIEKIIIDDTEHRIDDEECGECRVGFPQDCACGGLVHAQWDVNGGRVMYLCDSCESDDPPED